MDVRIKSTRVGRHSSHDVSPILVEHERPIPPDYLSPDEAEEWEAIAARLPANFFPRELHPLLAAYCQHVVLSKDIMEQIRLAKIDCKALKSLRLRASLQNMLIREHRAMATLAVKLHLTAAHRHDTTQSAEKQEHHNQPFTRPSYQVQEEEMDYAAA